MTDTSLSTGLHIEARPFSSLGKRDHGWLKPNFHFSFSDYYDPARMSWGAIRVWNDDEIAAQSGFAPHAHDNMEIITIPLEGDLAHKDSMGNESIIKTGDVQVMSAGTGIRHSEFNPNASERTKLFQIWVFPKIRNVEPRYQQISLDTTEQKNNFAQILSPNPEDAGVWIHQDAWFYLADFEAGFSKNYELKKEGNGLYVFVISGTITVDGQELETRDGLGLTDFKTLDITATTDTKFLLMEIPMEL